MSRLVVRVVSELTRSRRGARLLHVALLALLPVAPSACKRTPPFAPDDLVPAPPGYSFGGTLVLQDPAVDPALWPTVKLTVMAEPTERPTVRVEVGRHLPRPFSVAIAGGSATVEKKTFLGKQPPDNKTITIADPARFYAELGLPSGEVLLPVTMTAPGFAPFERVVKVWRSQPQELMPALVEPKSSMTIPVLPGAAGYLDVAIGNTPSEYAAGMQRSGEINWQRTYVPHDAPKLGLIRWLIRREDVKLLGGRCADNERRRFVRTLRIVDRATGKEVAAKAFPTATPPCPPPAPKRPVSSHGSITTYTYYPNKLENDPFDVTAEDAWTDETFGRLRSTR